MVRMYRCGFSGWCCKEVYIYIDFFILLIPTPLVLTLFCSSIPTSLFIFKMFLFFFCAIYQTILKEDLRSFKNLNHANMVI